MFVFVWSIGCTPTSGTRILAPDYDLNQISSISVTVSRSEEFSVRLSRQEMTATGAVLGSAFGVVGALVGTGIEAGGRSSADRSIEEQFAALVSSYDPATELRSRLAHHLRASRAFRTVASGPMNDQENRSIRQAAPDSRLNVTITEWGLRRCVGPRPELVQIGFSVTAQLVKSGESTIWQREELYLSGDCQVWPNYLKPTLAKTLSQTVDNLAGKLVNEILYP